MRELSLHALDIAQNSISAGARLIELALYASVPADTLCIVICDDGSGMTDEQQKQAVDPFYTTRKTRRVGLGISLFKMAAELSGGEFSLWSESLEGTCLSAAFALSHIDRMPAGDFASTLCALIQMNPALDFVFTQAVETADVTVFFRLDTRELRQTLEDVSFSEPEVMLWLREYTGENGELFRRLCPAL
jgi:hypothetical protein